MSSKIGEVIEASTTEFLAQCYELYNAPALGSLVKTGRGARLIPFRPTARGGIPNTQGVKQNYGGGGS